MHQPSVSPIDREGSDDGLVTNRGIVTYTKKSWWDHVKGVFARPVTIATLTVGCFGALWTMFEALSSSLSITPNRPLALVWTLSIACISAVAVSVWSYVHHCPDGLEEFSLETRRIAQLQRPKWEARFAKSVLAQLIAPIDRDWKNLRNDNSYVVARFPRDIRTYYKWLEGRTENCRRMLTVAKKVIVLEFATALTSPDRSTPREKRILDALRAVAKLYEESVAFERESLAIIPPEAFKTLHELQMGWADPIRAAIHDLFRFLQCLCDADLEKTEEIHFNITFGVPPNCDEYCRELEKIGRKLPQMIAAEW